MRAYLIKLSEAKLREAKTSKPENYARLGVEDTSAEGATGLSVELSGLKAVRLIVGVASGGGSPAPSSVALAKPGSWLVSGDIIPGKEGQNWLAREVLDVPSADIHSVAVIAPDKSVLKVDKPDPSAFNYSVHNPAQRPPAQLRIRRQCDRRRALERDPGRRPARRRGQCRRREHLAGHLPWATTAWSWT